MSENPSMKIGFILPMGELPETGRPPSYRVIHDLAMQADGSGLDSIWVYDHLLYRFPERETMGVWECWSMLSALAQATDRVEIGTLVMPVSWRNPALLAKMAATVDEISSGRLILGLGTGYHRPEFDAYGYRFDHLADQFEEAMEIITSLLRTGHVDFQGEYFSAADCELRPRGPRADGPPILVASRGPRMLRLTAKFADAWNTAWFGPVEGSAERRADLERACVEVGRDAQAIDVTVGVHVAMPELLKEPEINPETTLCGTPEQIGEAFRAYKAAGVSHLICGALADMTPEYTSQVMTRVAEAVTIYRSGS
jgi:alkanesulfonate monooxygenase SsuD/methylene tetrahydromethanopterin reductase-like flavin-dependent oxidoreductase (luciferase family)